MITKSILGSFLFGLVTILLGWGDLFGLAGATSSFSETVALRIGAPLYPFVWNSKSLAQKEITVVTIDENFLRKRELRWPPPLSMHADLLTQILAFQPIAIFYDVEFDISLRRQEDEEELSRLISALASRGDTAVLLAGSHLRYDKNGNAKIFEPGHRLPKELKASLEPNSPSDGIVPHDSKLGLNIDPLVLTRDDSEIVGSDAAEEDKKPRVYPSPAMALYLSYCNAAADKCLLRMGGSRISDEIIKSGFSEKCHLPVVYQSEKCTLFRLFIDDHFKEPLTITWGRSVSPRMEHVILRHSLDEQCNLVDADLPRRLMESWRLLVRSMFNEQAGDPGVSFGMCVYAVYVTASQFIDDTAQLDDAAKEDLFRNKLVLIGADHDTSTDKTPSPAQGLVPGVHSHAMALDNLINYDQAYIHEAPAIWKNLDFLGDRNPRQSQLIEFSIMGGLFLLRAMLDHYSKLAEQGKVDPARVRDANVRTILGGYSLIILAAVYATMYLRWSPINWAGLGLITAVFNPDAFLPLLSASYRWIKGHLPTALTIGLTAYAAALDDPLKPLWLLTALPVGGWTIYRVYRRVSERGNWGVGALPAIVFGILAAADWVWKHPVLALSLMLPVIFYLLAVDLTHSLWPWAVMILAIFALSLNWIGDYLLVAWPIIRPRYHFVVSIKSYRQDPRE